SHVDETRRPDRERLLVQARRLRGSLAADLLLVAAACLIVIFASPAGEGLWHAWYRAVGLPLFYFLELRWLWRWAIWLWLMFRFARLAPRLDAMHPDREGGLSFLGEAQAAWAAPIFPVAAAWSAKWWDAFSRAGAWPPGFREAVVALIGLGVVFSI